MQQRATSGIKPVTAAASTKPLYMGHLLYQLSQRASPLSIFSKQILTPQIHITLPFITYKYVCTTQRMISIRSQFAFRDLQIEV